MRIPVPLYGIGMFMLCLGLFGLAFDGTKSLTEASIPAQAHHILFATVTLCGIVCIVGAEIVSEIRRASQRKEGDRDG